VYGKAILDWLRRNASLCATELRAVSREVGKTLASADVISRDTVVSRDEFTILYIASRDRTVHLYANRQVASTRDYRISITAEPMKF